MNVARHHTKLRFIFFRCVFISSLICLSSSLFGETVVGGSVTSEYYLESIDPTFSQTVSISGDVIVSSYSDMVTLSINMHINDQVLVAESGFEYSEITPEQLIKALSLTTFSLEFYPLNNVTISIGKFPSHYGQSEIINPLLVFSQTNYAALLKGNLEDSQSFPFLIKTSYYTNALTLDLLIAPYIPEYKAFPVSSPWFPKKNFPKHLDMGVAGIKTLDEIAYGDGIFFEGEKDPLSLQLGLSGLIGASDITVFGFYGWNSQYPITSILSFDSATYSVELLPNYQKVFSLGAALATTYDRVRLFSDMLYTPQKLYSSNWYTFRNPYAAVTLEQNLIPADAFSYTIGGSIDIPEWYTFIQMEFYDVFIVDKDEKNIPDQAFSQLLSTMIRLSNTKGKSTLNILSLHSFADSSSALFVALKTEFSQEFVVEVTVPIFLGEPSSDFGQYKDFFALSLSCQLHF